MPDHTPDLLRKAPLWIVAAMLALVPLATGNLTGLGIGTGPLLYDTIALPRLAIALVLTLAGWTAWFVLAARRGEPLRVDLVWALLGGLAAWAAVSAAFSPHRALAVLGQSERLEGVVTVVLYALLYGLALQVVRRIADARVLVAALAGAATLLAVYGLAQYAGFDPFDYTYEGYTFEVRRAFATFGNPVFFAGLLVLALPPLGALAIRAEQTHSRMLWSAATIVVAAALFATFTRGAWIAAALQVALGAVVLWRARKRIDWRPLRVPLAAAAVALLVMAWLSAGAQSELNIVDRLGSALEVTGSAGERAYLIEVSTAAASARPLTGHGPDTFLPAFRMHRPDGYVLSFGAHQFVNNAHSWPLQYLSTLGVPGVLLLAGSIIVALVRVRRRVFAPKRRAAVAAREGESPADRDVDLLFAAMWIGCLGFAVHMLLGVAVLGATVPFWVMLGIIGAPGARSVEIPSPTTGGVASAISALVLAIALFASIAVVRADVHYLASRNAFHGLAAGDAVELARSARALNPTSVKYARGLAEATAVPAESAIGKGEPDERVRELYGAAEREFAWVLRQSPNDYPAHAWLAALQARVGLYLEDDALLRSSQETAQVAARLDRQAEQVFDLSIGTFSDRAINSASAVWPLP